MSGNDFSVVGSFCYWKYSGCVITTNSWRALVYILGIDVNIAC